MTKKVTKNYCCQDCGNLIERTSALYRKGLCISCSHKGNKHFRFKGYPSKNFYGCRECGKKISYNNYLYGNRRCRSCSKKGSLNNNYGNGEKISGKNNPCYGLKGQDHPSYKNGSTLLGSLIRHSIKGDLWIKKCLKRDNFTCKQCGKQGRLVVHHLKPFAEILNEFLETYGGLPEEVLVDMSQKYIFFWELDNGITLCEACHKEIHKIAKAGKELE